MRAALLTQHNQPLVIADVQPCELAPGQLLVNMLVSGICGKQLAEIRGDQDANAPLPRILGHEGCGIVAAVGPGVTKVKVDEKVVCHWRKGSGMDAAFPPYYLGTYHRFTTGRIATFAEQTIISENRVTAVPYETPNELCALLGCGLSTAFGVMENEAKLKAGESVLVVGCGGVGLNLVRVSKMMGAHIISAIESNPNKKQSAYYLGANYVGNSTICGGKFDVIVDTTGCGEVIADTLPLLAPSGRFIMVGQPKPETPIVLISAAHMFEGEGKSIKATQGGGFMPDRDIPRYVAMWKSGHLKIDGVVTHRYKLDEINQALDCVRAGNAGRALIEMV